MGHQVRFGNTAPVSVTRDADDETKLNRTAVESVPEDGAVTEIEIPDGYSLLDAFAAITAPGGVWDYHSDAAPDWVSSTHKGLADLLKEHFESGPHDGHKVEVRKHDTRIVTVFGDPKIATPAAHRKQLASHASRLGVKAGAVEDAAAEPEDEGAGA